MSTMSVVEIVKVLPKLDPEMLDILDQAIKEERKRRNRVVKKLQRDRWTQQLHNTIHWLDSNVRVIRVNFNAETNSHLSTRNSWRVEMYHEVSGVSLWCSRWQVRGKTGPGQMWYVRVYASYRDINGLGHFIASWGKHLNQRRMGAVSVEDHMRLKENAWIMTFVDNPMLAFEAFQ